MASGNDDEELLAKFQRLSALVNSEQNPNINALWSIAKDIEAIKLNIKSFGYDLALRLKESLPKNDTPPNPGTVGLKSKPATQSDIQSRWVAYWAKKLNIEVVYHRKIWELCYVLQALSERGMLRPGNRGLGFGCGQEPIPSLLASLGVNVTVTDLDPGEAERKGWTATNQHVMEPSTCFRPALIDKKKFFEYVNIEYVNMNFIPERLCNYDFCWSICALEHLGSIAKGLEFIENSLNTVKPGGIAVHTTEFNFANDKKTIDNWPTVLFQRHHFQALAARLTQLGHTVAELDFNIGNMPMDMFIDLPPFAHDFEGAMKDMWSRGANHLKVAIDGFPATCFGLIVQKKT